MDDQDGSFTLHSSLGVLGSQSTGNTVPSQVLFMDTHDMPSRTNTHPPASAYYQVATPKSPHELALDGDDEVHGGDSSNETIGPIGHSGHPTEGHHMMMGKSSRESEEMERLKYETAKNEILDKLHLHTLIGHKEMQRVQLEIRRADAQMHLLKKLHEDKDLLGKIEKCHERKNEMTRQELSEINATRNSTSGHLADASLIGLPPGTSPNDVSSASSGVPTHHYHTRSKSQGNVNEVAHLRPANSAIIDLRLTGSKSISNSAFKGGNKEPEYEILPFRPNQMNLHHRRNYSSTSLTSNSGVVGKTESNEAIFRRYDGILIVITCANCNRSGFTSAQGIVNHARLKHGKTYSSQPLAVLHNQKVLDDDKQDPQVLEKFRGIGKDPKTDYLPCEIAIPSGRRSSHREVSPKNTLNRKSESQGRHQSPHSSVHLEKMYNKDDFKDLVAMVNEAQNDLDVVLKHSESESRLCESEEGDNSLRDQCDESDYIATSSKNIAENSSASFSSIKNDPANAPSTKRSEKEGPAISSRITPKENGKKRKNETNGEERDLKERLRPAEKKARRDALALSNIPDHEKRSSHYNLRPKSKLKGINSKNQ